MRTPGTDLHINQVKLGRVRSVSKVTVVTFLQAAPHIDYTVIISIKSRPVVRGRVREIEQPSTYKCSLALWTIISWW